LFWGFWRFWSSPCAQGPDFSQSLIHREHRLPDAIVALNIAYLCLDEPPCSRPWADDAYLVFGRCPGSPEADFSQKLNNGEQPLALCNRRLKQSLIGYVRASLKQAVGRRGLFGLWKVPGVLGGAREADVSQNVNGMQQPLALCNRRLKQSIYISRRASV
jgi:hypothetical protein